MFPVESGHDHTAGRATEKATPVDHSIKCMMQQCKPAKTTIEQYWL
jgi:hypothetical protein